MCNGFNRNLIAFSRVPEGPGGSCRAYFQRKPLRYVVVAIAQPRSHVCHSNAAQASHAATQPEKGNLVWNMLLTTRLALSQVRLQVTLADERYSNIFAACRRQRGFMCKDASVSCETSREGTGANGPWNVTAENLWWKAARLDKSRASDPRLPGVHAHIIQSKSQASRRAGRLPQISSMDSHIVMPLAPARVQMRKNRL